MFSGRLTGMRVLVWRLYIPLGSLATAALIPPNVPTHGYLDRGPLEMDDHQPRLALSTPGWGRLQRVQRRRITAKLVTYILSSSWA